MFVNGCVNIEIKQRIEKDGYSKIQIIYNFSKMAEVTKALTESIKEVNESKGNETNLTEYYREIYCKEFYNKTTWNNTKCWSERNKIIMEGETYLNKSIFEVSYSIPYIIYKYDLKNIYEIMYNTGRISDEEGLEWVKLTGTKIKFILEMPGKIVRSDVGVIKENKIIIDVYDLIEKDSAYVESRELNLIYDLIVILVVGIIIFVIVIIKKKRRNTYLRNYNLNFNESLFK